jgi:hypothetical protein
MKAGAPWQAGHTHRVAAVSDWAPIISGSCRRFTRSTASARTHRHPQGPEQLQPGGRGQPANKHVRVNAAAALHGIIHGRVPIGCEHKEQVVVLRRAHYGQQGRQNISVVRAGARRALGRKRIGLVNDDDGQQSGHVV